jgi:hypothetical protein
MCSKQSRSCISAKPASKMIRVMAFVALALSDVAAGPPLPNARQLEFMDLEFTQVMHPV